MLHISDIEKRLKIYPEPKEIEDIRKNIKESFSKLEFIEDGHKYYLHLENGDTKEMNSVSSEPHLMQNRFKPEQLIALALVVEQSGKARSIHLFGSRDLYHHAPIWLQFLSCV